MIYNIEPPFSFILVGMMFIGLFETAMAIIGVLIYLWQRLKK